MRSSVVAVGYFLITGAARCHSLFVIGCGNSSKAIVRIAMAAGQYCVLCSLKRYAVAGMDVPLPE